MKDPNRIVRIEKAISQKYGVEAVQNPRSHWNDEKEKLYIEELKKLSKKEKAYEESEEKHEVNGILVSKKLLTRETSKRQCPICETYSFNPKDDIYMIRYSCCYNCYIQWVDGREERWKSGWRPPKGDK